MTRHKWIKERLDRLEAAGKITHWYSQGAMPGKRWSVGAAGFSRSYTTVEVEAFLDGLTMLG